MNDTKHPTNAQDRLSIKVAQLVLAALENVSTWAQTRDEKSPIKPIEHYPAPIAELSRQIVTMIWYRDSRLDEFKETEKGLRLAIDAATDEKGKKVFSNADMRDTELQRALLEVTGYLQALEDVEVYRRAVKRLEIDLAFLENQFTVAKMIYRRETEMIATEPTTLRYEIANPDIET